jgi:hypothetical protein
MSSSRVEAGSDASTEALRVVGGDEKGSFESETVKYGGESYGTRTREWLRWRGPAAFLNDLPVLSSERVPHINTPGTVWQYRFEESEWIALVIVITIIIIIIIILVTFLCLHEFTFCCNNSLSRYSYHGNFSEMLGSSNTVSFHLYPLITITSNVSIVPWIYFML